MGRGRHKRKDVVRTASGRISRARSEAADVEPLGVRQRMFGLSPAEARDQKAGSFVGLMRLDAEREENKRGALANAGIGITEGQYQASQEYLRLRGAFKRAIKAPDALLNSSSGGSGSIASTERYEAWCAAVEKRHEEMFDAIDIAQLECRNRAVLRGALDYCIERNLHLRHLLPDLRLALNALKHHFGFKE